MEPTYKATTIVTYDPSRTTPAVGDIVLFHLPKGALEGSCGDEMKPQEACRVAEPGFLSAQAVGRVVAGPGESVSFNEGIAVRNGQMQSEPFTVPCNQKPLCNFSVPLTVPPNSYYILFDDRPEGHDSRLWGAVNQSAIVGVVTGTHGETKLPSE
jgi:signal peptidase I